MRGSRTRPRPPGALHPLRALPLLLLCIRAAALAQLAEPATVRVAVFSLFHPQRLVLVRPGLPPQTITRTEDGQLDLAEPDGTHRTLPSLRLARTVFSLHVQGSRTSLTRSFRGALSLTASSGELRPVVTLSTETAVAAIVAAESPPGAPREFLEAQAVAARSFLLANLHPRAAADTCDTTHCQLLREPPPPASAAARATAATTHLVLTWQPTALAQPRLVAAQWTASCAGHTLAGHPRTPADYPSYPVVCAFCRAHPDRWPLPPGTPIPTGEAARELWNRTHPDRPLPSLSIHAAGGQGRGHGIGLCQRGASALAAQGHLFREILAHYYPNTTLTRLL